MKKIKENKGITLIALIITIIVLLILAIVAISAVQGDGIIAHAKNARDDYKDAQDTENTVLGNYLVQLDNANEETIIEGEDNQQNDESSGSEYKNYKIKDLSQIDFTTLFSDSVSYFKFFMNSENTIDAFSIKYYKDTSSYDIQYLKDFEQMMNDDDYLDASNYKVSNDTWSHEGTPNNTTYLANGYPEIMQNAKIITFDEAAQKLGMEIPDSYIMPENIFNMFIEEIED